MDQLTSMSVFAGVVEVQSFSAAARRLGLSKSAVSKHVSRLEDRLNVRLLNRTTRRLSLTEAGEAFFQHCTRVVAAAEEAEAAMTRLHAEPRGVIRLNAPMDFGRLHVVPLLPDFFVRYPEVSLDMTLNDRLVDLVEEGYDLAIRVGRLSDSTLVARKLAPMRGAICASLDYLARHGTPEQPADLAAHNCMTYSYARTQDVWPLTGADGCLLNVKVTGTLRTNNGGALREALLAGLGVGMLPSFIVGSDLHDGRLREVMHPFAGLAGAVYAIYPQGRHLPAKVRVLIDFLAERLGPAPPWEW